MRSWLFGLAGLVCSVLALVVLESLGVIRLIAFMGEQRGTFLVPVLLLAGPLAGVLLANGRPGLRRSAYAVVAAACICLVAYLSLRWARSWSAQAAGESMDRGAAAARTEFGTQAQIVTVGWGIGPCPLFPVQVAGAGRKVWYWYDRSQSRIRASLGQEELRSRVATLVPTGMAIGEMNLIEGDTLITFALDGNPGAGIIQAVPKGECSGPALTLTIKVSGQVGQNGTLVVPLS